MHHTRKRQLTRRIFSEPASSVPCSCLSMFGTSPDYLSELCWSNAEDTARSRLRSATHRFLHVPRSKTNFGDRTFAFARPASWNRLPATIWSSDLWKLNYWWTVFFLFQSSRMRTLMNWDSMLRSLRNYHFIIIIHWLLTRPWLSINKPGTRPKKNWLQVVKWHALICTLLSGAYIHCESKKQYTLLMPTHAVAYVLTNSQLEPSVRKWC